MHPDVRFCEWAAAGLIDQLRSGNVRAGAEASDFVWEPMLSALRGAAGAGDVDLVLRLLSDDRLCMFGGLLSRANLEDERITDSLAECFAAEADEERQLGLFHQLVARRLDSRRVDLLSAWAEDHASVLIAEQRAFFAGPDVVGRLEYRMTAPEYAQKRWIYLYSAHALDDPRLIRAFVTAHTDVSDARMVKAAEVSLASLVD